VQRFGPRTVERIIALEPVRANVEPDSAKLSDGWAMVLDRELPTDGRPVGAESLDARAWLV
jgi:hypothetical protein